MGAKQSCPKCGEEYKTKDFVTCLACFQDYQSPSGICVSGFEQEMNASCVIRENSIEVSQQRPALDNKAEYVRNVLQRAGTTESMTIQTMHSGRRRSIGSLENQGTNKMALPTNSSAPTHRATSRQAMYEPLMSARRQSQGGNLFTPRPVSYRATGPNTSRMHSCQIQDQFIKAQNGLLPEQQPVGTPPPMFSARRSLRLKGGNLTDESQTSSKPASLVAESKRIELQKFLNSYGYSKINESRPYKKAGIFSRSVERQPIHIAAELGDVELVRLLIWNGADTNVRDGNMCYPKGIAMAADKYGSHKSVIQLLSNPEEIRRCARRTENMPIQSRILNTKASMEL